MTPTPDDAAMPDEPRLLKLLELFEAAEVESSYIKREALKWQAYKILGQFNYEYKSRANKPHADDARKAHEWLERHVAMPHDIKTIVYSALSAASKEQEKGNE